MHKHNRVFTSVLALLLCFLTVFSCAFADSSGYSDQKGTSGYPQPPTYKGGNNSGNSFTSYTDPVIVGYRFTCWRAEDWKDAVAQGTVTSANMDQIYSQHNKPGYKIGHSINIMCNAVTSSGDRRTDYANAYKQTGLYMPHMVTNGGQTDFLDKITVAQKEQASDVSEPLKITHTTATGLMLMDYSGSANGMLDNVDESSTFEFYEPIYREVFYEGNTPKNPILNTAFESASTRKPLVLYSGYYTYNQWADGLLNTDGEDGTANNLHTYIYGWQFKTQMGTELEGYERSNYTTISDIDYAGSDVLPFNQNPSNVIDPSNPNAWTNRNATLIATLCGLKPAYGKTVAQCTDEEFGVYDYIIVEPIMMYYYFYTRYYVTTGDTALVQAQSMRDKAGNEKDVWTSIYYGGYKLFDVCGKFPAVYGTYLYTEEQHFGVDGVFNATTQRGYNYNHFQTGRDGLNLSAIAGDKNNKSGNADRTYQDSRGWNTYATVFTTKSGYTIFTGGDHTINRSVSRTSQMRIQLFGENSCFLSPYIATESLIGVGIYRTGLKDTEPVYKIVYHPNTNSGGANNMGTVTQTVNPSQGSMSLYTYQTAIIDKGLQPVGKIPTSYWTLTSGNNGYGIADNTLSGVQQTYPNTTKNKGKIAVTTTISGKANIENFFLTYGDFDPATNATIVHLYAAWNTKSLVTTIDRNYDSTKAQTLKDAALYDPSGSMWFKDGNYLPTAISVVAGTGDPAQGTFVVNDIIQLQKDTSTGYQWFQAPGDSGNLDNKNYKYYVVYSFSKNAITDSDKTAAQQSINGTNKNNLLTYRNNGAPVQWTSNTNLFYFDFYSFDISAPNCTINATIKNYPDADSTITKQSTNGVLQMKLVRGSTISYTVTPDIAKGYYFDTALDYAQFSDWTNGVNAHIKASATTLNTTNAKNNNLISVKALRQCSSCKNIWDTGAAKCPKCSVTFSGDNIEGRVYYTANGGAKEVLGKQQHKYSVETGKSIQVIPRLDNVPMLPFNNYFVDIVNVASGQTYIYSSAPMTGAITIPSNANGVVKQAITGDSQYYILVSATDQSGREHMQTIKTVNTTEVAQGATLTVYVDFYSASMTIKTQSGGNHSGMAGQLFYTLTGQNDISQAISMVSTTREHAESHTCSLCSETTYSYVHGIGLKGLQLNMTRDSNADWYLTSVKKNTTENLKSGETVYASSLETAAATSYNQSATIAAPYHVEYTAAPYHYIVAYRDGVQVNTTDVGITKPTNHDEITDTNGKTVLRGKYGSNVNTIGSIVNANTKAHCTGTNDRLNLTYNQDAVIYTTLQYYTVTTDADNGYSTTTITSVDGTKITPPSGSKVATAWILSNHNNYSIFTSCSSGNPKETDDTVTNNREYTTSATLTGSNTYADTTVSGKITAYGTKVTKETTFTGGTTAKIKNVNAVSKLYWRSNQTRYDLKFIFTINDVPYDSLPQTINDLISLDGNIPLKFSTDSNGRVIATGKAVAGTYNLYLAGKNTGKSYTVTTDTSKNEYLIKFYTLRVAAGVGISNVQIKPVDKGNDWNGTLPYYRDGRKFATTVAVWPESVTSETAKIAIDAMAEGEYKYTDEDGNIIIAKGGEYAFDHWDTKRPTSNIKTTFDNGSTTKTTTRQSYVDVSKMNHATVVQAEATPGSPIDIPTVPEHNSVYYGVKVRTFLDGRLKTPWTGLKTTMDLSNNTVYETNVQNGVAAWAICLDLYDANGTPLTDPYKNKSASALLAPSKEFEQNGEINTEYFYSGSNAYIANQYTYIDAFYYTQTIQTQVNGVNTDPWTGNAKEALYRQYYKSTKVDTTQLVKVSDIGTYQTIMLKGMKIKVGGLPVNSTNEAASAYTTLYENFEITGNHAFIIPYYTVDMKAFCDTNSLDISCSALTLTFRGSNMKTSVSNNTPAVVMAGSYSINTNDTGTQTSQHSDGHKQHYFVSWDVLSNRVYKLEYVDSGDGKNPYPVLTYTGEERASSSTIASKTTKSTTVNVSDETHLVARYAYDDTFYTLKLNAVYYDETGKIITPAVGPITMYRGNDAGDKSVTPNGESNRYVDGTKVNVSATLDPQTIYYPQSINVTFKLACPHCNTNFAYDSTVLTCPSCKHPLGLQNATASNVSSIYYATADSWAMVQSVVAEASMMPADAAAAHLLANHVVEMKRTSAGTYTGTIPYAEEEYHLYVNGEKQGASYDVKNTKKKEFVWGNTSNTIWSGTTGINGSSATTTSYSDFYITMNQNREYTAYARQVVTGESPSSKSIEFVCATIFTSTDYTQKLPYENTYVYINGVKTPLSSAYGHTFFVAKNSKLEIQAQRSYSGARCDIFSGTISTKKTFLLSYNTVTVSGVPDVSVGIDGTGSQSETWLAHYAIDKGALVSANTTYGVFAEGGSVSSKKFYRFDADVNITAPGCKNLQLVAVAPTLGEDEELIGTFEGAAGAQYLYVLKNTAGNAQALGAGNYLLSQHDSVTEKYIIGFSTNAFISGNEANKNVFVNFQAGIKYNVIVNWSDFSVRVVAAEGSRFNAAPSVKNLMRFYNIPNGAYEIHMDGTLLITSDADIVQTGGAAAQTRNLITINGNASITTSSGTRFDKWTIDNTPGSAANATCICDYCTTHSPEPCNADICYHRCASAGTVDNSINNQAVLNNQILSGTINYYASSVGSGNIITSGTSDAAVQLKEVVGYRVQVYLDDKLNNTFPKPVKFNGSQISLIEGESAILNSITFPTVSAVADSHDTAYTQVYGQPNCTSITYDATTRTFKVYYYTVTFGVNPADGKWGEVLGPNLCNQENWAGGLPVAKGTTVNLAETVLDVGNHTRIAAAKQVPGMTIVFKNWTRENNDNVTAPITSASHFVATFVPTETPKDYTVTLYNKTGSFTALLLNQVNDSTSKATRYAAEKLSMTLGMSSNVTRNAPESVADKYLYGDTSRMTATITGPFITTTTSSKVNITLNLTGYTSERAHTVILKNTATGTEYTSNVAANTFKATFNNIPSGYYQLYIDGIKYTTPFNYDTHDTSCKVTSTTNAVHTPHYETESGAGGLIYVAPQYTVRYTSVSHWSQVRYDRVSGKYFEYANLNTCTDPNCSGYGKHAEGTHVDANGNKVSVEELQNWTAVDELMDPAVIRYHFECNECGKTFQRAQSSGWTNAKHTTCPTSHGGCGSTHIRMVSSVLESCEIDEDLFYYVYSTYTDKNYAPLNITADVEMAYSVYVQSVVDGVEQYPFFDNGTKLNGAQAKLEFSQDGNTWNELVANFDDNGLATFYVPMGTSYRIVGAHTDEFALNRTTNNFIDGGFALSNPYSLTGLDTKTMNNRRYIIGDGDYNNDNNIDDPGITYYVHYYTVTAKAGHGVDDVNTLSASNQSKYSGDTLTTKATYQRGATAKVNGAIADGYLPVYITLSKDNAIYTGRTVYLSTSSTSNTKSYKLTYNSTTKRYEHNSVFGTTAGTNYYVWADGKLVNGTYTYEYTGVRVLVKPYIEPAYWSGNCGNCLVHTHGANSTPFEHSQTYVYDACVGDHSKTESNHVVFNSPAARDTTTPNAPYTHTFVVYHTTVEQLDVSDNTAQYFYQYASEHPTDPTDPGYDPTDPDIKDEFPQNTVYYYTLEVTGDAGTNSATGSGIYLEGQKPNVDIGIQPVRPDVGRTPITVTLYLDRILWSGQTVTIGGYPAKEISTGVYKTDYNFASGTYAVNVISPDTTLLDAEGLYSDATVYGYITVTSTRTYTWKAWTDGHVKCSECGAIGACCDTDGTPKQCNTSTTVYCTNCHLILDANSKEQSCCTTGDKKHTWTTCPYNNTVHHGNCLDNLSAAQTTKSNSVTMWHNTKLHGVTTHVDNFKFTGDNSIYFYTLHIDGDAGVDNVYIDGVKYEETETIHNHGTTAASSDVYHNELPERLWTNTYHDRTFFKEVVVRDGRQVDINITPKQPTKNHAEAKTALSIALTIDGKPYIGRTVTIGGYKATDADNDGIYVTSYSGFVGGKTYQVTVDGRNAGRIYLESHRSYRWYTWEEPWIDESGDWEGEHECLYHGEYHYCGQVLNRLWYMTNGVYDNWNTIDMWDFTSVTARTEIIDEFHIYVDANQNGGPDPYNPETGDPDDPYKDPTDDDFYPGDEDIWGDPDTNPEEQPNPEYNPNHKPTDNPNYDPVNPGASVDPSKDPDNFNPNDQNDGFYEDAPVPFYTLTVNTRLNNSATDDFPVKFENLTSGVTLYIVPDGQTYHVYDSTGKQITNVPYIVSMADGTVKIALQDGDKYRISVLDEIEDRNNNDVVDISDIKTSTLNSYTYTTHTESAISKKSATVTIDFYTLTLKVYSDGALALPNGKSVNGSSTKFESPVWLDDVNAYQDGAKNWWGETFNGGDDSRGDTGYYAVADANTVKVYLKGQSYDVNVKTADDDQTNRGQTVGTGYLVDYQSGTVTSATTVTVEYFSMTVDHHGGFTGTQINYGGKTHVSATTTAGATGNATAKAFFLKDTSIGIDATVATNNTWYQWTGTATYSTKAQTGITMNQKRAESAWAKTFYTVRYYLHDKSEGWYEVVEDRFTSTHSVVIDNRNWNSVTVTGEPNKYVNFDPFRTHSYSDPTSTSVSTLRDVLTNGVNNTTIDVVINANQVGGQSFVDFYYTRNGSKVDPTPDTPVVPPVTPNPEEPVNPTPQKPEDWNPDTMQEYVTITYVMNGGKYNNSSANYSETHLAGTDITLITPTPPAGQEFVGWFLTDLNGTTQSASGLIGTGKDHYLLCTDTVVYAVYVGKTDLGITANDIYGSIKTGSQFTSSATIVNHNKLSVTPTNHINAVLTIKKGNTVVDTITIKDVIAPGNGTQMISTVVDTTKWDANATYTLTWSLDFSNSIYVDKDTTNNQSSLNSFKPNTYSSVVNTARPGYSTDRPSYYDKDIAPSGTSNTAFYWEYWTWNENSGYNGTFSKQSGKDKMNIVIMLTPENESGLRTYTTGAFGMHNYTTRSGYGLSMHRVYNDLSGVYKNGAESMSNKAWAVNKSHITVNSTVGTLEALMTFPEFNYGSTYKQANGAIQDYIKLTAANAGTYYSLTMPQYSDYETDDYNDQFAHYTPMWLPNGEYIPVTHISGVWTPIGELRATVQQGQYTNANDMHKYGVYTNEVIIKGSLFDDLYNNP